MEKSNLTYYYYFEFYDEKIYDKSFKTYLGPSRNDVTHLGGGRDLPKGDGRYSISPFSKIGDKREGRGQKSQKMGDVIYGYPSR